MLNTIDLMPYLNTNAPAAAKKQPTGCVATRIAVSAAEVLVTLLIGLCFLVATCAFCQIV